MTKQQVSRLVRKHDMTLELNEGPSGFWFLLRNASGDLIEEGYNAFSKRLMLEHISRAVLDAANKASNR